MKGLVVNNAGILSLVQDGGRFGAFNLGLTNGGPADPLAFYWANKLCGNNANASTIEISLGGLQLTAQIDCVVAITGAPMPLTVNGVPQALWESFFVAAGDIIKLDYAKQGVRCYLAVVGGFNILASFGSTSTVCRESVGGLNGGKLVDGDILPCHSMSLSAARSKVQLMRLPVDDQPDYPNEVVLRTVLGYQQQYFSTTEKRQFFSNEYQVSNLCDRMGYRLQGTAIKANIDGILSEGICYGAIQIPADGQPIVLLNDRQTIGGYPKIGAVISQDCAKLAQCRQGDKVLFEAISIEQANNLFHLNASRLSRTVLVK